MEHAETEPTVFHIFCSTDEFRTRPQYRDGVGAPNVKLLRIVGSYRLTEPVRCGVLDCEQTHGHGYIVRMDDETETNTGWDCGLDHFGVEFMYMRQQYDRLEREYPHREALRRTIGNDGERLRALVQQVQQRPYGGNWLLSNLRRFEELYPKELLDILWRHSEKGEVNIFDPTADSAAPAGSIDAEKHTGRSLDVPGPFTAVHGLNIFKFDTDRWPLFEIEIELEEFLQLDVERIPLSHIIQWHEWVETLESRLTAIDKLIDEGKKFFRRSNLDLLKYLVEDPKARELLTWIVFNSDFPEYRDARLASNKVWRQKLRRLIIAMNQ